MSEKVTFRLTKIVRDGVLKNMLELGQEPNYRELEGDELLREQVCKVQEEAGELEVGSKTLIDELAQLQSAMNALRRGLSISEKTFADMVDVIEAERGGFTRAYYVDTLTLDADDEWVAYYRQDPGRFPEIKQ